MRSQPANHLVVPLVGTCGKEKQTYAACDALAMSATSGASSCIGHIGKGVLALTASLGWKVPSSVGLAHATCSAGERCVVAVCLSMPGGTTEDQCVAQISTTGKEPIYYQNSADIAMQASA